MSNRGAEFRKADFQIHSPRDGNWDGARPEDGLGATAPAAAIKTARDLFCRSFIEKCVDEGLRAISITDHHEGVYCYRLLDAKAKLEAEKGPIDLWIFPGMELTCKDACQALVIFDANLPATLFEKARAKLGLPADTKPDNSKGITVELLDYNVAELQGVLDGDAELRDRFIIFPHVKPGGHKTVLREGFHKRFKDLPYVGGYMDQCYPDQLNKGDRRILDGEIPAWASEKRGVFFVLRRSPCRLSAHWKARDMDKTGIPRPLSPSGKPCSLRILVFATKSRNSPVLSLLRSRWLAQNTSKTDTYNFNQQMNSVIGGRGAGKSTLLEYVRFALGCSAIDGISGQGRTSERLQELLLSTLDQATGRNFTQRFA